MGNLGRKKEATKRGKCETYFVSKMINYCEDEMIGSVICFVSGCDETRGNHKLKNTRPFDRGFQNRRSGKIELKL